MSLRKYPPGPPNVLSPVGLTVQHVIRMCWDPLTFVLSLRKYGDLSFYWMFWVRTYVCNHPRLIREVLINQADKFRKIPYETAPARRLLGNGLVLNDGPTWLRQRRLLQPAFAKDLFRNYAVDTVEECQRMVESWHSGAQVEMDEAMTELTLRIAGRTLFNKDLSEHALPMARAALQLSSTFMRDARNVLGLPDWMLGGSHTQRLAGMSAYRVFLDELIRERRANPNPPQDFLTILLEAVRVGEPHGMSEAQMRDEVMTIFLAGFHANSMALVWTLYSLLRNPAVAAKLDAELQTVLAGRAPTYDDLPNLTYTMQVTKESLRMYPPAWILFGREALEDVELGGFVVPKGSRVNLVPYLTHHDPRFFPEPETFNPERFAPAVEKQIPHLAWFPFGAGPHVCIGQQIAMMQIPLALAALWQRVKFEQPQGAGAASPVAWMALRPRGGLPLIVNPRRRLQTHKPNFLISGHVDLGTTTTDAMGLPASGF